MAKREKSPPVKVMLTKEGSVVLDPPTLDCPRKGKTKHRLEWVRDEAGQEFTFVDFYVAPIDKIKVDKKKNTITARNRIRKKSGANEWHYVIVSLRDAAPVLRSFSIRDGRIEEEPVSVETR